MDTPENLQTDIEIEQEKIAQLWSIISGLTLEDLEEFEFDGINFLLLFFEPEEMDEDGEAWFSGSTEIDGVDIYLLKTLPLDEKKKKLFHEVLEAWAQAKGFFDERSHNFAVEQKQKFFES